MRFFLAILMTMLTACAWPWNGSNEGYMFNATITPQEPTLSDTVTVHYKDLPKAQYDAVLEIRRFKDPTHDPAKDFQDYRVNLETFTIATEGGTRDISVNLGSTFVSTTQESLNLDPSDQVGISLGMVDGGKKIGSAIGLIN